MATMRNRAREGAPENWNVFWRCAPTGRTESLTLGADKTGAQQVKQLAEQFRHERDSTFIAALLVGRSPEELLREIEQQQNATVTVAAVAEEWLECRTKVGVETRARYRRQLDTDVLPFIGDEPIDRVNATQIAALMARLQFCDCVDGVRGPICARSRAGELEKHDGHTGGLSVTTLDRYYTVINAVFRFAVMRKYRDDNPVKEIESYKVSLSQAGRRVKSRPTVFLKQSEMIILLTRFTGPDRLLVDFLAKTGARICEATATKVNSVIVDDPDYPVLAIRAAWRKNKLGEPIIGAPKAGSYRDISIPTSLVTDLQPLLDGKDGYEYLFDHVSKGQQGYNEFKVKWDNATVEATRCPDHPPKNGGRAVEREQLTGPRCGDNGGLTDKGNPCAQWLRPGFDRCSKHVGPRRNASSTCKCWDKRIPRRPNIHDLRHSHASWLNQAGWPIKDISARLGHSTIEMTSTQYVHLFEGQARRSLESLKF